MSVNLINASVGDFTPHLPPTPYSDTQKLWVAQINHTIEGIAKKGENVEVQHQKLARLNSNKSAEGNRNIMGAIGVIKITKKSADG